MANSNNQSGGDSIGGLIAILLFFGIIIFATAPGMLSMFLIKTGLGDGNLRDDSGSRQ